MAVNIDNFTTTTLPIDSPRTLEAALSLGVELANLYPKTAQDLLPAAGYKQHVAAALAEKYEERRAEAVEAVRHERGRLASVLASTSRSGGGGAAPSGTMLPSLTAKRASGGVGHIDTLRSASIERERYRNERTKLKQEEDLRNMIANEERLAKLAESNAKKEAEARHADAVRLRERQEARKRQAEARRAAEVARKADADARVAYMRKEAAIAFAEEAERVQREDAEYRAMLAHQKREEDRRRIEQAEADARKEAEMEAQAVELERRLREWEMKEADRAAKLAEFRAMLKEQAEAKAREQEARLEEALKRDAAIMLTKREQFNKRIADAERERAAHMREVEAEMRRRAKDRAEKQARMREALIAARRAEFEHTLELASAAEREEDVLMRTRRAEREELEDRMVRNQLHLYERMEGVKAQRRRDEYNRMRNLLRMMTVEKRMEHEEQERKRMAVERQRHQKKLLLMKFAAETELERMRVMSDFTGLSRLMEKATKAASTKTASGAGFGATGGGYRRSSAGGGV